MEEKTKEYYELEITRLKECIGSWRRLAQEKAPVRKCVREGYDDNHGTHYKVFAVKDIPGDLPLTNVLDELKKDFLKKVYPFKFERLDYDDRQKCWMVKVVNRLEKQMEIIPFDLV